jgi:hypothetical protein
MTRCKTFRWGLVLADEAAAVRNTDSMCWRTIQAIPKDAFGGASATPAQNRVTDWTGVSLLMWVTSAIKDVWANPPVGVDSMVLLGLQPSYTNDGPDEGEHCCVKEELTNKQRRIVSELQSIDDFQKWKWWYLVPSVQRLIRDHSRGEMDSRTLDILKANQMFIVNRGMNTPVMLPNGQLVFPQNDIPPQEIWAALLGFGKDASKVAQETDDLLKNYSKSFPKTVEGEEGNPVRVDEDTDDMPDDALRAGKILGKTKALNWAIIRALVHGAFDRHAWELLGVEDIFDRLNDEELTFIDEHLRQEMQTGARIRMKTRLEGTKTNLGTEHVQSIINNSSDGGISWTFAELNKQDDHIPPNDRASGVFYTTAKSPAKTFALEQFCRIRAVEGQEHDKVLLVMNDPLMQQ